MTDESLKELKEDLDEFLKEESDIEKEAKEKKKYDDINPFSALLGLGSKKEKKKEPKKDEKTDKIKQLKEKGIEKDNWVEKMMREQAEDAARVVCFKIFDVYKKAHGMASHPDPFEYWNK